MKSLSPEQSKLLDEIKANGPVGMYVVRNPSLQDLLDAGLVTKKAPPKGYAGPYNYYVATGDGRARVGSGSSGSPADTPLDSVRIRQPADELVAAFLDLLDGNTSSDAISDFSGLPRERCVEISALATRLINNYDNVAGKWVRK
jgi:hypothetical protein